MPVKENEIYTLLGLVVLRDTVQQPTARSYSFGDGGGGNIDNGIGQCDY
jgi:hypothetical protein